MKNDPAVYEVPDPKLWTATVQTGGNTVFAVDATFKDGAGVSVGPGAIASASILVDDFTLSSTVTVTTDASGHAVFQFPAGAQTIGTANRFLHVSAGPTYPLVEQIIALP